jgi:hypothetical protein
MNLQFSPTFPALAAQQIDKSPPTKLHRRVNSTKSDESNDLMPHAVTNNDD